MISNLGSRTDQRHLRGEVVVVGAGIVGASCAYALALRGFRVYLVDREAPARGSSGACEGNLVLWDRPTAPDLELARWSHARWAELADELREETGLDIEFDRKGSLMLAHDEDALKAAHEKCTWLAEHNVVFEWLDGPALREAEPALAPDLQSGVYFPLDAQIEPRIATAALVAAAQRRGAAVHLHDPVVSITPASDGCTVTVTTSRHEIDAAHVIVAAGVWTPGLLAGIADIPVTARKGQVAVVSAEIKVRHKAMEAGYVRTVSSDEIGLQVATVVEATRSGSILLGSSRLGTHPDDRDVDMALLNRIMTRALRFFPGLATARFIRSYAGLRPMSPDHTPIVGPLPRHAPILVATGHEGGGVMMAAATGELIARRLAGETIPVSDEPYLPARLAVPTHEPS